MYFFPSKKSALSTWKLCHRHVRVFEEDSACKIALDLAQKGAFLANSHHPKLDGALMAAWDPRVNAIFLNALAQAKGPDRLAFLEKACGDDAALRRGVEEMLAAHDQAGCFLARAAFLESCADALRQPVPVQHAADSPGAHAPVQGQSTPDKPSPIEKPSSRIGPYKLLSQIGEGGMGTVFMAEQTDPVRRLVALKVIKPGTESKQVIARFEAERQALAHMDHPNIAKVLDAGATDAGHPYFVMELVKGVPITEYCDEQRLTPQQRLELFVPVCKAVQHAHQKGIIHRDLKPTNVLIAQYDGKPVLKVIDFGVAKATGQKMTDKTLFTDFGALVGTLEYMSPEQAEVHHLDIDTRSDIYSLGVMLFELLTGTTPLERKRLRAAALLECLRIIREEEAPRPSTRLSNTEELPSIAAMRSLEPKKLSGVVRGDLDLIVMKCLEKDRNRRYETADGLASDVQHYLVDEPVLASPPSTAYHLRRFARRHKVGLWTTAAVLLAAGGLSWALWDRAERDMALGLEQAKRRADSLVVQTHQVLELIDKLILTLIDAESGQRGFLVTAKDEYLASFDAAHARSQELMATLKDKTRDNARQQERIQQLDAMSKAELDLLKQGVDLRRNKAGSRQLYDIAKKGKQQMDAIREVVAEMQKEQEELLVKHQQMTTNANGFAMTMQLIATAFGLFVVGALVWLRVRPATGAGAPRP
jgi:serine/threonine protein kinase/CHASE3 domain sensor protein